MTEEGCVFLKDIKEMGFSTKAVHAGQNPCPVTGALSTPIYQTSTFVFENVKQGADRFAGKEDGYIYTRLGNPTQKALEDKMAILEGGEAALALSSGMAAVSAVIIALTKNGDHIVADKALYGCTFSFMSEIMTKYGVEVTFIDTSEISQIEKAIRDNTKIIYFESPANPTMKLVDMKQVADLARSRGIITVIDNTFMSPYFQRPIEYGIDVVLHSATKYISGHGDVIAGIVISKKDIIEIIRTIAKDLVGVISPFNAWLLLRGLKTLAVRMDRHSENALTIAEFLASHDKVKNVFYPGLPSHPQYGLAKKQMNGFGGMISFELKGGYEAGKKLMDRVKLCHLAVSLGDVDTLIQHPASMTHAIVPVDERLKAGITDGLVRLSVGIEDVDDIVEDLEEALR